MFTQRETFESWFFFFNKIKDFPLAIVCDGQRGMIKAILVRFPNVKIQRCFFHIAKHSKSLLTNNPQTKTGQELLTLVKQLFRRMNKKKSIVWKEEILKWESKYEDFLKEKTYYYNNNLKKQRWFYTHKNIRRAFYSIKPPFNNLFTYLEYPNIFIPHTSNSIEGGINSPLKSLIYSHRGKFLLGERQLISFYLRKRQSYIKRKNL